MSAIIFDFDGTIADSIDYYIDYLAREAGHAPLTDGQRKALHHLPLVAVARSLGFPWRRFPGLYFSGRREMDKVIRNLQPFPGMPEVIRKLHAEGHELFIVSSNSVHNMHAFLRRHELQTYFLEIYGGVVMFGKAPAFRRLLRDQNLEAKDVVCIGDELRDLQAAQSLRLKTIAVSWGFATEESLRAQRPNGVAQTPEDIIRIMEEL